MKYRDYKIIFFLISLAVVNSHLYAQEKNYVQFNNSDDESYSQTFLCDNNSDTSKNYPEEDYEKIKLYINKIKKYYVHKSFSYIPLKLKNYRDCIDFFNQNLKFFSGNLIKIHNMVRNVHVTVGSMGLMLPIIIKVIQDEHRFTKLMKTSISLLEEAKLMLESQTNNKLLENTPVLDEFYRQYEQEKKEQRVSKLEISKLLVKGNDIKYFCSNASKRDWIKKLPNQKKDKNKKDLYFQFFERMIYGNEVEILEKK